MHKPKFEIVLVDADETIFDFQKAEYTAFNMTLNSFGKNCSDDDFKVYSDINLKCWKELEKGTISRETLKVKRFDMWFEYMGIELDSKEFNDRYAPNLGKCGFLIPGAYEFLENLSKICNVYIITNGLVASQTGRFNASTIKPFIKKLYISEAIGFSKPKKEFFDFCIDDIGDCDRSKYIVLGDSLTSDMQGGRNASIVTCRYSRNGEMTRSPLCDYEIDCYEDFFKILYT
ncbi:MAG: noncanonical pyrimidine nucleotidase, YjjG family [Ruminococcaceae bacterium]|nr:noncanonical pyrimidine nucleotidase, YjjG family [Oscillospiraceae bacterium]